MLFARFSRKWGEPSEKRKYSIGTSTASTDKSFYEVLMEKLAKKDQPVYQEMKSLAPYFLIISGIYMVVMIVLGLAMRDLTLPVGGVYGIAVAVLNFLMLGKCAQKAIRKTEKQANVYMSGMYCLRYLGLFCLLTIGALAPFINLIAAAIPLFFTRIAIMIRTIKEKEE